jgi:hypothetical protein
MPPKAFECSEGHRTTKLMGNPAFKVTDEISCPRCGSPARKTVMEIPVTPASLSDQELKHKLYVLDKRHEEIEIQIEVDKWLLRANNAKRKQLGQEITRRQNAAVSQNAAVKP